MSMAFTKLFASITESTVWCEPDQTRITWIAMLAMADAKGRVWASIPGLANRARVSLEQAEIAINTFLSPDKYSRTPDNDGRRIEPIDGGWRLLNYEKYRAVRDAEATKESKRNYINERRAKEREGKAQCVENVELSRTPSNQAEEEAEASSLVIPDGITRSRRDGNLPCPHQKIVKLYNTMLTEMHEVIEWNEVRQGLLRSLWNRKAKELDWKTTEDGLGWFGRYFEYCKKSDFLNGRTESSEGKKPFIANLEWIIRPTNFAKITEGNYHA